MRNKIIALCLSFCVLSMVNLNLASDIVSAASKMDAPVNIQIVFFYKIFALDKNLALDAGEVINVGVLYMPTNEASIEAKNEVLEEFRKAAGRTISELPVKIHEIEYTGADQLSSDIQGVSILYIVPGNSKSISTIRAICKQHKTRTFTSISRLVLNGVCVGIGIRKNKPKIIINRKASQECGADFSADLLELAEIL